MSEESEDDMAYTVIVFYVRNITMNITVSRMPGLVIFKITIQIREYNRLHTFCPSKIIFYNFGNDFFSFFFANFGAKYRLLDTKLWICWNHTGCWGSHLLSCEESLSRPHTSKVGSAPGSQPRVSGKRNLNK